MMVIYEVSLFVERDIYSEFYSWLQEHVTEMLQFPGFVGAIILTPAENNDARQVLIVQYRLRTHEDLDRYFSEFAAGMREKGIKRFGNKFSAERRILDIQDVLENI
ncbi:DUF4286 family protein [Legionella sp. CNM-4043-24]|uniref:DUF4286 family protein n=1 Tax=Legionella sp. CNM-4043-24 TaxID=3421646 RepID=UPI00403AAA5E